MEPGNDQPLAPSLLHGFTKGGVFELLVEEVWLVRCEDADMDPEGCTAWPRTPPKPPFAVKEYPRVLLRLPLMNC